MVNSDLDNFLSFVIRCVGSHAPLYLAAQLLRVDLRTFGETAFRILLSTCPSVGFPYVCSGLSILCHRLPFVRELISHTILNMAPEEQKTSSYMDNIHLLEGFGIYNTEHSFTSSQVQTLIQRSAALIDLTSTLKPPATSLSVQPIDSWERVRNVLLRLPSGYFDDQRALDPKYDPFLYLAVHKVHIAVASPSSKTSSSFASLLLSSLSLVDFTRKISGVNSQEDRKKLLLQALGSIGSYIDIEFSPDTWGCIRNCPLYIPALQKLLQIGWIPSFVDAFTELYRECANMSLSDIRRTAESCGEVFRCTTDYSVREQLLSFMDLREDVCILQRRVFLRFFVVAASPPKVDAAIVRLFEAESTDKILINIPNTPFSKQLLKNLALTFAYTALLEPLE